MSSTRPRRLGLLAALLVLLVGGPAAHAEKKITLLGVRGVDGKKITKALEHELRGKYTLVSAERYRRVAHRMKKTSSSDSDVSAVARALGLDAVLGGAVVGRGKTRRLVFLVRRGSDGNAVVRGRYDLSGRTLPLVRQKVIDDVLRGLDELAGGGLGGDVSKLDVPTPSEPTPTPSAPPPATEPSPAPAAGAEGEAERGAPLGELAETTSAAPKAGARTVSGISAAVGPSVLMRSLSFDAPSAPGYAGGMVYGVRVEGAVFPLGLSAELAGEHPVLASFGLAGSYESIFGFTSTANKVSTAGQASRWNARFIGRIPLGHDEVGGALTVDTGLWRMSWSHAAPVDIGVPDVRYDLLAGGFTWERPLGTRFAILGVRAGASLLLSAGDIGEAKEYGSASGWGLQASGALTSRPLSWLWLRLYGSWDRVALGFSGAGTRYARSAVDSWFGGALEVGFAL